LLSRNIWRISRNLFTCKLSNPRSIYENMNYDVIIVKIPKPHIKKVLAHHLAADPSVSLQKALSLLDNLPVVYSRDLSAKELEDVLRQMAKLGVECQIVESKNPLDFVKEIETPPKDVTKKSDILKVPEKKPKTVSERRGRQRVTFQSASSGPRLPIEKKPVKRSSTLKNVLVVLILCAAVGILFVIGKNKSFKIKSTGPLIAKKGSSKSRSKAPKKSRSSFNDELKESKRQKQESDSKSQKESIASPQKRSSDSYTDSAASAGSDYTRAIKFYKIAISFNRNNLRAWQGLLAAYRGARMWKEAEETKGSMADLFQEDAFSIGEIVKPYGVLSQYKRDEYGVCRIEYRSHESQRSVMEKETFFLIRALIAHESCQTVSLYASTGTGRGMLVRVATTSFPASFAEYRKRAQISFTE